MPGIGDTVTTEAAARAVLGEASPTAGAKATARKGTARTMPSRTPRARPGGFSDTVSDTATQLYSTL